MWDLGCTLGVRKMIYFISSGESGMLLRLSEHLHFDLLSLLHGGSEGEDKL